MDTILVESGARPAVRRHRAYVAVILLAVVGPALFWRGGILEREAVTFILQYTADRPLLQKVFDPHANDHHTYQARELSYFFDYVDATVYASGTARLEPALLIPVSAVVTSLLFVPVFARGIRRTAADIDPLTGALVLACFASSFVFISTLGMFYRSGKPMLALLVLAYLFHVWRAHQVRQQTGSASGPWLTRDGLMACAIALFAGLLDRQGVFYVLLAFGVLLIHVAATRQLKDVLAGTGTALLLLQVYNFLIGPFVILQLNGYWPSLAYQRIPPDQLVRLPSLTVSAADLLLGNTVAMLGGTWWITLPFLGTLGVLWARVRRRTAGRQRLWRRLGWWRREHHGRLLAYVTLVALGHVLMFALMIARHPWVYEFMDHRYWYYPAPFAAVLLFGMVMACRPVVSGLGPRGRRVLQAALLAVVIGNLTSLPRYSQLMTAGEWFGPVVSQSELLKASLRRGAPDPELRDDYLAFFAFAEARRARNGR